MKIEAMLWILVLILVALAILYPKTRSFSFSAIGLVIVAIVVIVVIAKRPERLSIAAAVPPVIAQEPVDFERFHVEKMDKVDPDAKSRIRVVERKFDSTRYAPSRAPNAAASAQLSRAFTTIPPLTL